MAEIRVHPPDSLLRYEPPVFVGLEPSQGKADLKPAAESNTKEGSSQLEDMVNSMLPPR